MENYLIAGLSLTEPYAHFVWWKEKLVETRGFYPRQWSDVLTRSHLRNIINLPRLLIAIQTPQKIGHDVLVRSVNNPHFVRVLTKHGINPILMPDQLAPRGKVIAVAELDYVEPITPALTRQLSEQEKAFGIYHEGRFAWFMKNIQRLDAPVPCRGWQSIGKLPDSVKEKVMTQISL